MVTIIKPEGECVECVAEDGFITLSYKASKLFLSTLPRSGNFSESVFLKDGALAFIPGNPSVLAAYLAISSETVVITLLPLGDAK